MRAHLRRSALAAIAIAGLFANPVHAELWERLAGGAQGDGAYAALALPGGDLLLAAYTYSGGAGKSDAWILRLNSKGDTLWHGVLGGAKEDELLALAPLGEGRVALGGYTKSRSPKGTRAWLVRLGDDNKVTSEWVHPGPKDTFISGMVALDDGGLALSGWAWQGLEMKWQLWVARLDAGNKLLWEHSFGGPAFDNAGPIVAMADGGFLVAGVTQPDDKTPYDAWLLKLDGAGALQWQRKFGGARGETVQALVALPGGDLVLAGHTASKGAGKSDAWVVRLDPRGKPVWDKAFGGADHDSVLGIVAVPGGGVIVVGETRSRGGDKDGCIARLADDGALVWEKAVGGAGTEVLNGIAPLADGTFAVVGWTDSKGKGRNDVWYFQVSADGALPASIAVKP